MYRHRVLIGLVLFAAGCNMQREEHPLAIAGVEPRYICADDNHQTPVTLTAVGSLPVAVLPGNAAPQGRCVKRLNWEITGSPYTIVSGHLNCTLACPAEVVDCPLEITFPGHNTADVTLTVWNDDGMTDFSTVSIGLTLGEPCD